MICDHITMKFYYRKYMLKKKMPVTDGEAILPDEVPSEEDFDRDINFELDQEEEDIRNDPVRANHFNYSEFSCLVNGSPEIFLDNDGSGKLCSSRV